MWLSVSTGEADDAQPGKGEGERLDENKASERVDSQTAPGRPRPTARSGWS